MNNYSLEKAILVGVKSRKLSWGDARDSLAELKDLCETSGAIVLDFTFQDLRDGLSPNFLGLGKIEEVAGLIQKHLANLVVIDEELSPNQNKSLQDILKIKVVDRTGIILDIFAKHARTREGKIQVALAQAIYTLPRLVGMWEHFSRQKGGIGMRGPGETQLEVDRRRLRERIGRLREEISQVQSHRRLQREQRESVPMPLISLVGYTNAGKSSLMNLLTNAGVLVEDQLFATLDPTVRRCRLPSGRMVLFADTVGFISRLPHELVESFKATFEEASRSVLLLHVMDVSCENWKKKSQVVRQVLKELDLHRRRVINVFNKVDLVNKFKTIDGVAVSALKNLGIEKLLNKIELELRTREKLVEIQIPYDHMQVIHTIYEHGVVVERKDLSKFCKLKASLNKKFVKILQSDEKIKVKIVRSQR